MFVINKKLAEITAADLDALVTNKVTEGKHADFKRDMIGNSDNDKKEFLKDVSSFANAAGGDLFIGVDEAEGVATKIVGLSIDADKEILRLDAMIRSGIDPRIPSFEIRAVPIADKKCVIIIHVRKSWMAPHMVTYQNMSRFFSRTSNGVYQLDVTELKNAFVASETAVERIRAFRNERVARLLANETPVPFEDGAKMILHIMPVNAFDAGQRYDVLPVSGHQLMLKTLYSNSLTQRINLDGVIWYQAVADKTLSGNYAQIFHNGVIESVTHNMLRPRDVKGQTLLSIPSTPFETKTFDCIHNYIEIYGKLGIEPPYLAFLSMTGVKGYRLGLSTDYFDEMDTIDRDVLLTSEVLITDISKPVSQLMRPIIDQVWNACGRATSVNYNEQGEWVRPRA